MSNRIEHPLRLLLVFTTFAYSMLGCAPKDIHANQPPKTLPQTTPTTQEYLPIDWLPSPAPPTRLPTPTRPPATPKKSEGEIFGEQVKKDFNPFTIGECQYVIGDQPLNRFVNGIFRSSVVFNGIGEMSLDVQPKPVNLPSYEQKQSLVNIQNLADMLKLPSTSPLQLVVDFERPIDHWQKAAAFLSMQMKNTTPVAKPAFFLNFRGVAEQSTPSADYLVGIPDPAYLIGVEEKENVVYLYVPTFNEERKAGGETGEISYRGFFAYQLQPGEAVFIGYPAKDKLTNTYTKIFLINDKGKLKFIAIEEKY